jgi:Uma2 family endonuclease
MSVKLMRHMFNVIEYHKMIDAGIFIEDDHIELINGEIIEMTPIGSRHAGTVKRLNNLFSNRLCDRAIISIQDPVHLNDYSEPEPDIALLKPRDDFYSNAHPKPKPDDLLLIIEIADTSIGYDREVKIPLYAESLIQEVWILNLNDALLEVYREPQNSKYQNISYLHSGQTVTPSNFADLVLTIDEIFK